MNSTNNTPFIAVTDVAEQRCRHFLPVTFDMMSHFLNPPYHGNLSIVTRHSFPPPPVHREHLAHETGGGGGGGGGGVQLLILTMMIAVTLQAYRSALVMVVITDA